MKRGIAVAESAGAGDTDRASPKRRSMSTTTPTVDKRTDKTDERFVPIDAVAPMITEKLVECNDVHDSADAGEAAVYAVAHQQGVVQRDVDEYEREAMNTLYMTADGEQAVERWYLGEGSEDFSAIYRAFVVDEVKLTPTGKAARRFAPITRWHPEVEN